MKKLKKSVKVLLISGVSVLCALAIVLGCVFGLKKDKDQTGGGSIVQGYELTSSQKVLMNAINANASYAAKNDSQVIKEFHQDKYVDENGLKFTLEDVSVFEDKYFVSTDTLKQKYVYFYPKNGETKSTTLLKSLQTQYPENYNCSSLTIHYAKGNFICFSYKEGESGKYYEHYEMAYVYTQDHIEIVQDYKFELDYLGRMNYLGKYTNLYTTFSNDFYIFEFQTADRSEVLFETHTYAPTKSATLKTVTDNIVVASDFSNDFNSYGGFYILNKGVVSAYSYKSGVMKKFTFVENTNSNYYYNYKVTGAGIVIEEKIKVGSQVDATFHSDSDSAYVKCNYKFLSFENGNVSNLVLYDGYVKATAIEIDGYDGFCLFMQKANKELKLLESGKMVYFDGSLQEVLKYDAISSEDIVSASNGVNFLTKSGLYSTKKSLDAEFIVDFSSKNYSLATKSNNNTFAAYTKNGIFVFDYDGNKVFDKQFTYVVAYDNGYYYASLGDKHYILNTKKPNQPIYLENFSEELSIMMEQGYGLYLTETQNGSDKLYSFYDYTGNPVIENVAYSNFGLNYNSEFNYTDLSVKSDGKEKVFIKQNSMLMSSGVVSSVADEPVPFATGSGSDNLSDTFTTAYPQTQYSANKVLTIRRINGKYPKSGKVYFTPSAIASGGTLVVGSDLYFTFSAMPKSMTNNELIVSVTTNGVASPMSSGGFIVPSGFDTGIGYVTFDLNNIQDQYTVVRDVEDGVCFANFQFYYQDEDVYYTSETNTDSNVSNYAHASEDDITIMSLSDDFMITFDELVNNVIGSTLDRCYATFSSGDQYMLEIYKNASGGLETENFDTTEYIYRKYSGERAYVNQLYKFYSFYEANSYNISYDLNGGEFDSTQYTVAHYDSTIRIANPTKYGYTFNGWSITGMDTNPHYIGNSSTSNTSANSLITVSTYYKNLHATHGATVNFSAQWIPNLYYVEFNANGGMFSTTINAMSTASNIVSFRKGFYQEVMYAKSTTDLAYVAYGYNNVTNKSGPILLSAKQNGVSYTYLDENGNLSFSTSSSYITIGGVKWYYSSDDCWTTGNYLDTLGNDRLKLSGSMMSSFATALYYAKTNTYGMVVEYDEVESLTLPTRTGYVLNYLKVEGMSDNSNHEFGPSPNMLDVTVQTTTNSRLEKENIYFRNLHHLSDPTNVVMFNAQWNPITYNLSYDYNGGALPSGSTNPTTATYGTSFSLVSPLRTGYTFDGWQIHDADGNLIIDKCTDSTYSNMTTVNNETIVFTARWSDISYNVVIEYNDNVTDNYSFSVSMTEVFTVPHPTRTGYTFAGWTISGTVIGTATECFDTQYTQLHNVSGSTVTFDATWTVISYDLVYDLDGGTEVMELPVKAYFDSLFYVGPPRKLGYIFVGWKVEGIDTDELQYGDEGTTYTLDASDITEYVFVAGNIQGDPPSTVDPYAFYNLRNVTGTVYLTAYWDNIYYNISYDLNDNGEAVHSGNKPTSAAYSTDFEVSRPSRVGYEFVGWTFSGLSDDCEHVYWETADLPINFTSDNGYYYQANSSALEIVNATKFKDLRCESGTATLTAVWRASIFNVTYHYLPLDYDALVQDSSTINTISEMTSTKTTTIHYGKPFVSLIPTASGTGTNEAHVPSGVNLVYWAFSTTANFAVQSATKTSGGFTAISGTKLYIAGAEAVFDYATSDVHAYAVYEFPQITLKFYIPNASGSGNNLANYVYAGEALDAKVSYGSAYVVKNSVTVDNSSFLGWMVSANHYIAGSMSNDSVSEFEYGLGSYTMSKGNSVVWGYTNTGVYDVNNPVYYLYAVYSYQAEISAPLVAEELTLANVDHDIISLVNQNFKQLFLNEDN